MFRRSAAHRITRAALPVLAVCLAVASGVPLLAGDELAIGARGPDFNLKGTDGAMHSLDSVKGPRGVAVIFTCNTCPYAKGYEDRLIALAKEFGPKGVGFVAINPNDPKVAPGEEFEAMVTRAKEKALPYPYLVDTTQQIAAAYGARVTPHIFLLDASGTLVYRGRIDDSLEEGKISKRDLRAALDAVAAGRPVPVATTKAFGCGVKWSKQG